MVDYTPVAPSADDLDENPFHVKRKDIQNE
jgi:hypothetical protein